MKIPRATRVRQIQNLKALGLSNKEIGKKIGLRQDTVRKYARDPEGLDLERSYERLKRPCPCGRRMISTRSAKCCWECNEEALRARRRRWTPERVIGALQRYYFEQGHIPTQEGMLKYNQGHYCGSQAVANAFGSWSKGLDAAGFPPRPRGKSSKNLKP